MARRALPRWEDRWSDGCSVPRLARAFRPRRAARCASAVSATMRHATTAARSRTDKRPTAAFPSACWRPVFPPGWPGFPTSPSASGATPAFAARTSPGASAVSGSATTQSQPFLRTRQGVALDATGRSEVKSGTCNGGHTKRGTTLPVTRNKSRKSSKPGTSPARGKERDSPGGFPRPVAGRGSARGGHDYGTSAP